MRKNVRYIILILGIVFVSFTNATENWRTHLMYASVTQVAETPTKVFGLSDGALFAYDKSTQQITVYTKANGLSDSKVSSIIYSTDNQTLVIIYDNANIDLLADNGSISNIPFLKNKAIGVDKTINKVNIYGDIAYLSAPFGIIAIDLKQKLVANGYMLKMKINAVAVLNNTIYAATQNGVLSCSFTSNLFDPNRWTLYNSIVVSDLEVFENDLVGLNKSSGIYKITLSNSELKLGSSTFLRLKKINNQLFVNDISELTRINSWSDIQSFQGENIIDFSSLNSDNQLWSANGTSGLNSFLNTNGLPTFKTMLIKPKGPIANSPYRIKFRGDELISVGGGAWDDRYNIQAQINFFKNGNWSNIATDTISAQGAQSRDFTDFVIDPRDPNHLFISSYGEGVFEFQNNKLVKIHDHSNSAIETVSFLAGINHYDRVFGITYDKNNNLFVANMLVKNSIKVLTNDNNWISYNTPGFSNKFSIFNLITASNGLIVGLCNGAGAGIFFIDTKKTIADQSDDQTIFYSTFNFLNNTSKLSISPNNLYSVAEDQSQKIWFGTEQGVLCVPSLATIFNADYTFVRPRAIDGNGNPDYLLNNEKVTAIAVDNANRKWLGTMVNGIFLVNEDGTKIIKHFTYENSPLLSNKILSIAIHPTTGEVFIGTDKGLISYTNDALESKKSFSEVYAYPNPVKPEFDGDITITGLKAGATIRIADSKGNSVFEGKCETEEILWNGKDSNNNRVDTGVYSVFAAVPGSLESMVTRIFIIK